jgi:hypothetical protein
MAPSRPPISLPMAAPAAPPTPPPIAASRVESPAFAEGVISAADKKRYFAYFEIMADKQSLGSATSTGIIVITRHWISDRAHTSADRPATLSHAPTHRCRRHTGGVSPVVNWLLGAADDGSGLVRVRTPPDTTSRAGAPSVPGGVGALPFELTPAKSENDGQQPSVSPADARRPWPPVCSLCRR